MVAHLHWVVKHAVLACEGAAYGQHRADIIHCHFQGYRLLALQLLLAKNTSSGSGEDIYLLKNA